MKTKKVTTDVIANTRATLPAQAVPPIMKVKIKADGGNTGVVFVDGAGGSGTADGYPLKANEEIAFEVDNWNRVSYWGSLASQVFYVASEK